MKRKALALCALLFAALLQAQAPLRVSASRQVVPGGVITVEVSSVEPLEELSVALLDGDTVLSRNRGVELDRVEGEERWVALLGVSSTIRPGTYELSVASGRGTVVTGELEVLSREFAAEEIRLNQSISELRRDEDPRKREEAIEMITLTNVFEASSRFWEGVFSIPVEATRRTSLYGDRRRFIYADGGEARSIHRGLDFAAPIGTPIYAPGAGRVVFASRRIVTGKSVVLEHFPGVYGLFYHLDSIAVSPGDLVDAGELLGTVGTTGVSTGPHLHWELRVGGVSVDPSLFLEAPLVDTSGGDSALSDQTEGG